jgi:hypothetical protein
MLFVVVMILVAFFGTLFFDVIRALIDGFRFERRKRRYEQTSETQD